MDIQQLRRSAWPVTVKDCAAANLGLDYLGRSPHSRAEVVMDNPLMRICQKALLSGAIVFFSTAAYAGQGRPHRSHRPSDEIESSRLTHLRGLTVENRDGERLGTVKDFIADLGTGEINFAVLTSGGILGVRSHARLVPVQALSDATAKTDTLCLDVSLAHWEKAPRYKRSDLARLDSDFANNIRRYYERATTETRLVSANSGASSPGPSPTGKEKRTVKLRHAPGYQDFELASSLIGRRVVTEGEQRSVRIADLLIDLVGSRPAMLVVRAATASGTDQRLVMPLGALQSTPDKRLVLSTKSSLLTEAPQFSAQVWQASAINGAPAIYRYEN